MIEIFFFIFPDAGVSDADGFSQVGIKLCFHSFRIPFEKCPAESVQFRRILSGLRLEPFHNLINKDFSDFLVRDCQQECISRQLLSFIRRTPLGQVTGHEKNAPQVINIAVQVTVCQFQVYLFCDAFTLDQLFQLSFCSRFCHFYEVSDDIVVAGIQPKCFRRRVRLRKQQIDIIYNIPWTVYI